MANERVEVDIVLDDGSIKKAFVTIEKGALQAGQKVGDGLEKGASSGLSNLAGGIKNQLLGLGAAFAGLAGVSAIAKNFSQLETAFAEIKTIIPDVTQANDALRQSFIDLSAEFGTSATEQANSFYSIVSAGITDTALAQEALTAANKLAIGGLTDTNTAIDLLTSSINAYGAESLSAEKASDVLFGAVRLGKTTVAELGSSLGQILPTASSLKVGFEDVAAATAALTTRGVSTSAAVTQLNAVLTAVLSKQAEAKKLGPEVADAFSLQALQTKGLTGFLRDLNTSLGGSEQALVKLIGSAEGARAILALSGDGFQTLGNNVEQLKNSAGAADAAFQVINSTVGAQTDQIFSKINALFLRLTQSGSGAIFSIVSGFNTALGAIITNFDQIATIAGQITQKIVAALLTLRFGPAIFSRFSSGLMGMITQLSILPTRMQLAGLSIKQFALRLKSINFASFKAGIKGMLTSLKSANIGLKIFNATVKLTKVGLTFGLALAFDFLIEKFIEVKDAFGGIGNLFKFTVLTVRKAFNDLIVLTVDFLKNLERIPFIGDKIKGSLGGTFDSLKMNALGSLGEIEQGFDDLATKVATETGIIPTFNTPEVPGQDPATASSPFPEISDDLLERNRAKVEAALNDQTEKTKDARSKQVSLSEQAFGRIAASFGYNAGVISVSQAELEMTAVESFKRIGAAATEGFARSFESIGQAIVKGENAFEAFGKAILGVLGDVAIQAGTMYTLLGIASFNPAQVAAGIALTILGGVLKAVAGGGGGSSAGAPGGGLTSNPIDGDTSPVSAPTAVGSAVSVNIQGDVLDSTDTGLRIAEILKDQGFSDAVVS